jgi:glycosyltransferase involved in cell wall biosynthesis
MPAYNAQSYIAEAIESVLQQSYPYWELLIVDDASNDNTAKIIQSYAKQDKRIKPIYHTANRGAAHSRNTALRCANGRYIAFLDSDDMWMPNKLSVQISYMQQNDTALCYSSYEIINTQGEYLRTYRIQKRTSYSDMLKTSTIGTLTMVYDTCKFSKVYFKPIGHEDYALKLDLLKQIDYAHGIDTPLARYRIHEQNISGNKIKAALWQWKIYRDIERLSFFKSFYYFVHYAFYGLKKYR